MAYPRVRAASRPMPAFRPSGPERIPADDPKYPPPQGHRQWFTNYGAWYVFRGLFWHREY